ncbi:DUF4421 family protein [Capnocytophaga gingivalis]
MPKGLLYFLLFVCWLRVPAQQRDSLYIQEYPHLWWVKTFVPTKVLIIQNGENLLLPNYPLNLGIGVGLRKVIGINILLSFSVLPLKNDTQLSSSITDLQMHKYGKKLLLDAYYQDYSGFYINRKNKEYTLFPELSVRRWGIESTYVLHNNRFSLRAAFEQSERQLKSAGSLIFGNGLYFHRIAPDPSQSETIPYAFENYQLGINLGYAYSWVASSRWLLAAMISVGANFGNNSEAFALNNLKAYPTNIIRLTTNYNRENWSIAFSGIFIISPFIRLILSLFYSMLPQFSCLLHNR